MTAHDRPRQVSGEHVDPSTGLNNVDSILAPIGVEFVYDEDEPVGDLESPVHSGQHGEIWLGEGDYEYSGAMRMRKPPKDNALVVCVVCSWPLPIRWSWRDCEFGDPVFWPNDDEVWGFCRCNGCLGRARAPGRPLRYCGPKCEAVADNARDRAKRQARGATPRQAGVIKLTA